MDIDLNVFGRRGGFCRANFFSFDRRGRNAKLCVRYRLKLRRLAGDRFNKRLRLRN
jgi:hypothetical protein